ncbi:ATP-binding protein [Methanospirillum hungatei]|uniref:ATP-binding protein n=1 Tax=Methanospirillum hungatei TaxID=2203 RepID=UPI0026F2DF09|nr:ATP-binding protein [Methanospirillum hungatei]MCA1916563.1 putative DNA binding domain-containing protein [Methanospirillum hungatei]
MLDSPHDLLEKIRLGEDNAFELKRVEFIGDRVKGPSRNDLADEIAAFANTNEAILILGVDDKTREILGIPLEKIDLVETYIRDICMDSINPPVIYRAFRITLPDSRGISRHILKIEIPRSLFVHQSPGGYLMRLGSSKRQMPPEYLARLFQQRSQARVIWFDEQTVPNTSISDLEPRYYERFITSPNEDPKVQLEKRGLLKRDESGILCATVSGVLLSSIHPEKYLTGAFIEAVHYRGIIQDSHFQVDARKITGPLDQQIDAAVSFVMSNQRISARKTPYRIEKTQYNKRAVFEAIVNAVAHRDYSIYGSKIRLFLYDDRLEIYSPGSLPNTITLDTIEFRQATRNELITSLLSECPVSYAETIGGRRFYMEKRGDGVPIIFRETFSHSGRKPEYRLFDGSELLLTIYAADVDSDE